MSMILQSASTIPVPDGQTLGAFILAFLAGMAVPTRYGLLRLRGFGRMMASKIPAKPPAGVEREEWLRRAEGATSVEPVDGDPDGAAVEEPGAEAGGSGQP